MRGTRMKELRRRSRAALHGHNLTARGFRRLKRAWNRDHGMDVEAFVLEMAREDLRRRK